MILLIWALLCLASISQCKKTVQSEIVVVKDIKEWKKELRTKKNVLSVFLQSGSQSGAVQDLVADVSVKMRGRATVIVIDCSSASKLCKKLKVSPKPHIIQHYSNGVYNKDYDRRMTTQSMLMFLEDPTGDLPWSEDETAKDVAHLDYQSFKRLLRKERLPVLAMFYTPWCGHCKRMKPEFSKAATAMKGKAVLMGMDCDGAKGISAKQEFNVTSFPTVLYFEKGELKFPFTGERTEKGITEWLADPKSEVAPPAPAEKSWSETDTSGVVHLKEATMAPFVQENPSVLVMFYAPWCGHCKSMKPELMAAAKTLADEGEAGKLAAVDVTVEKKLGEEHGIKSFPTVIYFKNGETSFEHPGLRKKEAIVQFMKDPKEPPPPAAEESKWSDEASDVVHLTGETFDSVKRKKHALVMFYAPWCGHCKKAKPEFTSAAAHFSGNNKVMLGAIDCTEEGSKGVCSTYGVKGYPTILYFTYGKDVHKYQGGRTQQDFILNLSDEDPRSSNAMVTMEEGKDGKSGVEWGGGVVQHLTKADYHSELSKGAAFVLYYKAGCTTCKTLQQHFTDTGSKVSSVVTLGAVDCLLYPALCAQYQLPALVYHKEGKDTMFPYSRTTRDMVNFVHAQKDEL